MQVCMDDLSDFELVSIVQGCPELLSNSPLETNRPGLQLKYRDANASITLSICWVSFGSPTPISILRSEISRGSFVKSKRSM